MLDHQVKEEARRRGWTPGQVRQEARAAGVKRYQDVTQRRDVQPTEEGLAFWHATREQYAPDYPRRMTGEPVHPHEAEGRAPTQAEIWRQQLAPGPLGYEVGQPLHEPHALDFLHAESRWARQQDERMHDCGVWVKTGPHASPEHHDCREVPGYIDAMHEDALEEDTRRTAEAMAQVDPELEQMFAEASQELSELDAHVPGDAQMPDIEAG